MSPLILLIEDNISDIELIQTAFEEAGVEARFMVFRDGEEAINRFQHWAINSTPVPNLVFLDLNLPRASGHEVLAAIRSKPEFKALPVLVFSTSTHPSDRTRSLAAGATDYLVKPPHFNDLLVMVNAVAQRFLKVES